MDDSFKISDLVAAEEELRQLKEKYGEVEKEPFWKRMITTYAEKKAAREPVKIRKSKYCLAALFGGWLGLHCFMVNKKVLGFVYLVLFFSGISFLMSILDIWYAIFLETDEQKCIMI